MSTISNLNRSILVFQMILIGMVNAQAKNPDFVVAADGSGEYTTVQDAINAVPNNKATRTIIFIKPGTYKEKIKCPQTKRT